MSKSLRHRARCSRLPKAGRKARRTKRRLSKRILAPRVLATAHLGTAGSVSMRPLKSHSMIFGANWGLATIPTMRKSRSERMFFLCLTSEELVNRYIVAVKKATLVKKISATQEIWTMYYEFSSFGISPRVFTVLQVTHYDSSNPRTGCVHPSYCAPRISHATLQQCIRFHSCRSVQRS
jgi:hypothetical protein